MRQPLLNKAQDALKVDPKNPNTLYMICTWGPIVGGASPSPDLITQVDSAAHTLISVGDDAFADSKKPANTTDDTWKQAKASTMAKAHQALAWADASKKDFAGAESEYRESLTVNPNDGPTASMFGKLPF